MYFFPIFLLILISINGEIQINKYINRGGKLSKIKIYSLATIWWAINTPIALFVYMAYSFSQFIPHLDLPRELFDPPPIEKSNSLDLGKSKVFPEGINLEDYLFKVNSWIDNDPENPDNYGLRGLIYFHLKKYPTSLKDLNKSIKMSEYIDKELYLARGLIYLRKSNISGDYFEKKGCRDIKIAVESDSDYLATKLDEEEISAVRRKCKI